MVDVKIPALRERKEDIPLLFLHFARVASTRYRRELIPLSQQNRTILLSNEWPGNVRELRNLAERFVLLGEDASFEKHQDNSTTLRSNMGLAERVGFFERTLLQDALLSCNGSIKDTMEMLSLPRKTLYDKMKKYDLARKEFKS